MTIYQQVQKYFSVLTICTFKPVYTGQKSFQYMTPVIPTTQFFLIPTGIWVNATPPVGHKKSTHWIKGALNYSLLHGHLSRTWQGKDGE